MNLGTANAVQRHGPAANTPVRDASGCSFRARLGNLERRDMVDVVCGG